MGQLRPFNSKSERRLIGWFERNGCIDDLNEAIQLQMWVVKSDPIR